MIEREERRKGKEGEGSFKSRRGEEHRLRSKQTNKVVRRTPSACVRQKRKGTG